MQIAEFVDLALDVPFVEKGRSFDGWDCWGLIYVAYNELYGIQLPDGAEEYSSTRRREELQSLIATGMIISWEPCDPHEPGDVALLRMMGRSCHVGLMLHDMWMLHVQAGVNAIVEQIDRAPWRTDNYNKIEGIYHHARRA